MAKRKTEGGLIIGLNKVNGGGSVPDARDEDNRLYFHADATVGEGRVVRKRKVGILISDAEASQLVLRLLANMLPRPRNKTVRTINRGGFGPPVDRVEPSAG